MAKKIKVYCETLDIWFNSIQDAAKYAGCNDWSMSKKMDIMGSFVDEAGNVYKRAEPMKTKNKYYTATNYTSVKRGKYSRKPNEKKEKVAASFKFADLPKAVQELIEEKTKEMIDTNKPWSEIKNFLKKMGCKKLTLKVEEDAE